jgi:hypothetical protein
MIRIVFGWNSFRIRSFSPMEFGIFQKEALDINIEVRQAYFHVFWIPFFSLGKRWVIRRNNKLYELPAELKPHIKAVAIGIKTPWYTFTGLILTLVVCLGFLIYNLNEDRMRHQREVAYFNADKSILDEKLTHITTKDFITLQEIREDWNDKPLFLKVEDIQGDSILVTPVESNSKKPMDVEREYNRYVNSTPSVKISNKQLGTTYPEVYDSSEFSRYRKFAKNLLGDGKKYIVKDVVRQFGPIVILDAYSGSNESDISIRLDNVGWPAIITDIKTLQGTIDWSQNINKPFTGDQNMYGTTLFFLFGKNYKKGEPYKLVMTLKDTTGQVFKYEINGQGYEKTIREL